MVDMSILQMNGNKMDGVEKNGVSVVRLAGVVGQGSEFSKGMAAGLERSQDKGWSMS